MSNKYKGLSWEPMREGDVFCSPACGRGCTSKEYETAVEQGNELAEKMGEGWDVKVWENLGWHSKVANEHCEIHIHCESYWINLELPHIGQRELSTEDPVAGYNELLIKTFVEIDLAKRAINDLFYLANSFSL